MHSKSMGQGCSDQRNRSKANGSPTYSTSILSESCRVLPKSLTSLPIKSKGKILNETCEAWILRTTRWELGGSWIRTERGALPKNDFELYGLCNPQKTINLSILWLYRSWSGFKFSQQNFIIFKILPHLSKPHMNYALFFRMNLVIFWWVDQHSMVQVDLVCLNWRSRLNLCHLLTF